MNILFLVFQTVPIHLEAMLFKGLRRLDHKVYDYPVKSWYHGDKCTFKYGPQFAFHEDNSTDISIDPVKEIYDSKYKLVLIDASMEYNNRIPDYVPKVLEAARNKSVPVAFAFDRNGHTVPYMWDLFKNDTTGLFHWFMHEYYKKDQYTNTPRYYPILYAGDASIFHNADNKDRTIDVFAQGTNRPDTNRELLIQKLKSISQENNIYNVFANVVNPGESYISFDEYTSYLQNTKIGVGMIGGLETWNTPRWIEVPLSGGMLLYPDKFTGDNESIVPLDYIDKVHCRYYKQDLSDVVGLIKYYLENPDERIKMAELGRSWAVKYHTLEARAQQVLNTIGVD